VDEYFISSPGNTALHAPLRAFAYVRQRTEILNARAHPVVCNQSDYNWQIEIAMKPLLVAPKHPHSRPNGTVHSLRRALALPLGIGLLAVLSACTGVSAVTKERVAQGETSLQQAQQTLGQSEHGALELQQARDRIAAAKSAMAKGQHEQAERMAAQAHLYSELAVAKSQSASARNSANEVLASLEMLRRESERNSPMTR
jgi:hypothetical protein